MQLAESKLMTLKKLLFLSSAVAGVAVLANKDRRNKLLQSTVDFLDNARAKLAARQEPVDLGVGKGVDSAMPPPDVRTF